MSEVRGGMTFKTEHPLNDEDAQELWKLFNSFSKVAPNTYEVTFQDDNTDPDPGSLTEVIDSVETILQGKFALTNTVQVLKVVAKVEHG